MTTRLSTGLRDFMLAGGSLRQAFTGGILEVRTGGQPGSANDAPVGTKLVTFSANAGAWTAETPAVGSIELTGGAGGSVNTLTVGGMNILDAAVPYAGSLAATAVALAAALNLSALNRDFVAEAVGTTVTLTTRVGRALQYTGAAIAATLTTITASYAAMAGGAAAVNGLAFGTTTSAILAKHPTQIWSGVAGASGSAGWFRLKSALADADGSSASLIRLDGSIAAAGGNLIMSPTTMVAGATHTLASFNPTIPAEF